MLFFDMDAFITITCTSYQIIPITVDYIKRTSNKQKPYNKQLKSHSHQYVLYIYIQFLLSDIHTIPFNSG